MRVSASGTTSVEGLQGPKTVLGAGSLEARATLPSLRLGELQLAVERMDLGRDVEDAGVGLVIAGDLGRQPPVVGATGQIHGLVVGRRLPADSVDEPHREWFSGGVADVGGGSIEVVLENGVAFLAESTECKGDWAITQFDVARLAHDVVGVGDDEVGESTVIFFESLGALCIGLARHLRTKISELLAELLDLGFGLEVLESAADGRVGEADGDGAKGARVELRVSLHDVEGTLGRERIIVSMDTIDDFAFLGLGVWGDGEAWTRGGRGGFGGRCARGSSDDGVGLGIGEMSGSGGWIHESDGGGTELCLGRDDLDGVAEDVDGSGRGRHVVVVWRCCCRWDLRERMETLRFVRPLLSCWGGVSGFFR
jgi:hypothetical protein